MNTLWYILGFLLVLFFGVTSQMMDGTAENTVLTPDGFLTVITAMGIAAASMWIIFSVLFAVLRRRSQLDKDMAEAQKNVWK